MAKSLKDIVKTKPIKVQNTLGGYKPKAGDEEDFAKKHEIDKYPDRNGNGDEVFSASNIKHSQVSEPHGYKAPKDKKVNEDSFSEAWIVTHKDGKVTTHAGQTDAMRASKQSPGSKVSATHGAMGQRASTVLEPHQRGNLGTFSAAGYTPPEKKKKLKEAAKCNMTEAGKMCEVHGLKECMKESKNEEVEVIDEMPTQYRSTAGMGTKRGWASKKAAKVAFQNPQPLREPGTKRADKATGDAGVADYFARGGKITQLPPGKAKGLRREEVEVIDEAVKTSHEDPLVTVHDKDGLHTHANLSTANKIFNTKVKHTDVHAGPVSVTSGREDKNKLKFAISKHHASAMKEEIEQVDEVLTKKEPASTWIRDFVHSKNPKFAGKSKKERQRMALGAYYAKQRNEEIEMEEGYKNPDQHFEKQSKPMQTAINLHLRKGKNYWDAVRAAKVHVKEDLAVPLLGGMDDESAEMAKAQLKALAAKATALADQLSDDLIIEPWVQSKITIAKDYVTTVHDYMVYGEHDKDKENEQTGPDTPMTFPNMSVDVNTGRNV